MSEPSCQFEHTTTTRTGAPETDSSSPNQQLQAQNAATSTTTTSTTTKRNSSNEKNETNHPTSRTISIVIPEDASAGDVLSFVVDGTELELSVPNGGLPAGHVLQIQVQEEEEEDNAEGESTMNGTSNEEDEGMMCESSNVSNNNTRGTGNIGGGGGAQEEEAQKSKESHSHCQHNSETMVTQQVSLVHGKVVLEFVVPCVSPSSQSSRRDPPDPSVSSSFAQKKNDDVADPTAADLPAMLSNDDGTYAMVWPTTQLVVERNTLWPWIEEKSETTTTTTESKTIEPPSYRILELGSGLGCLGLALAANYYASSSIYSSFSNHHHRKESLCHITLTDCAAAFPLLQQNVQHNQQRLKMIREATAMPLQCSKPSPSIRVDCHVLDWNHPHQSTLFSSSPLPSTTTTGESTTTTTITDEPQEHKGNSQFSSSKEQHSVNHPNSSFQLIVGSDLLYNTSQIPALVQTIGLFLPNDDIHDNDHDNDGPIFLFLIRWRKPELERQFFELTQQNYGLEWTLVSNHPPQHQDDNDDSNNVAYPCSLHWTEIGDPHCTASNEYFGRDMQISVHRGHLKVLADISPDDLEQMTTEEYEAWERAHIQVYRGQQRQRKRQAQGPDKRNTLKRKQPES